jgi:hypothetical protein
MCKDEGYVERCCLHHILSEIFSLKSSDANLAWGYVEVLWRPHHAPRRASHLDFGKSPGEGYKSHLNRGYQRFFKPLFLPVFQTAVISGYKYRETQTIYASLKNRRIPRFQKPRFSPVINTAGVRPFMRIVKTAEYRGFKNRGFGRYLRYA